MCATIMKRETGVLNAMRMLVTESDKEKSTVAPKDLKFTSVVNFSFRIVSFVAQPSLSTIFCENLKLQFET